MSPPDQPAGEHLPELTPSPEQRAERIAEIAGLPTKLRVTVAGLDNSQLDTKYKNWTIRQIVHHLADSHANAYVRFRLTLTEETPTIKPYDETKWAELPDAKTADVEVSLVMLESLHSRWVQLLRTLTDADFTRAYLHPAKNKSFTLAEAIGVYAHHGRHHTAQIAWLRAQHGWGA